MTMEELLKEYLASLSEKTILIRHDVDNIYLIYSGSIKGKVKKVLNYLYLTIPTNVSLRFTIPGYLENVKLALDIERTYSARATYFFRATTVPKGKLLSEIKSYGHEIAYHADRDYSYSTFYSDLKLLERLTDTKIQGYTKHGFSPVRSGAPWDERRLIKFGIKARLKYFAQGEGHYEWEYPRRINSLWVFGHHITLKKVKLEEAKKYIESRDLPLILIHPEDLSIPGEREKFEYILTLGRVKPIIEVINEIEKHVLRDLELT